MPHKIQLAASRVVSQPVGAMPTRGDWALPTYLLLASLATVAFLRRAVRDARERASAHALALLALALAELCWVLPCFAQCALTFYDTGARWWGPARAGVGCTVMGFYSVFASVAGQLLTAQIARSRSRPRRRAAARGRAARRCGGAWRSALLLAASLGVAAVPLARDGGRELGRRLLLHRLVRPRAGRAMMADRAVHGRRRRELLPPRARRRRRPRARAMADRAVRLRGA